MPPLKAGYFSCCITKCLSLDKSTVGRPCSNKAPSKLRKQAQSKLKASIYSWDEREFCDSVEEDEQSPPPSLYDTAPDIFEEEFPYSVAESRSENVADVEVPTEMIFKLDRRGSGWGEEIIPMLTIERRPLERQKPGARNRSKTPTPWQEGSLEDRLSQAGVVADQVESVAAAAAAWRVTPGGRPLIDRRRRTRVTKNLPHVVKYLTTKCGIEPGPENVGTILTKSPQILLANPKQHDRWLRRVIELAAFLHRFGHCNVPEKWPESPSLAVWVERQRKARASLCEERLQILYAIGFEFNEAPIITQEWEASFDMLVEWLMWHKEKHQVVNWNVMNWVKRMNPRARHLAVWVQLQRVLYRKELLPIEAKMRLEAIGFQWRTPGFTKQIAWMNQFGELLFNIERRRMKSQMRGVYSADDIEIQPDHPERAVLDVFSEHSRKSASGSWSSKEFERGTFFKATSQETSGESSRLRRLDRLSNLQVSNKTGYWLEKQRWLWRRGKLPQSKIAFLYCAGVELNGYSLQEWAQIAQKAAKFLNGYEIWTKSVIEKPETPPVTKAASPEENIAHDLRLYVAPNDIKEILADGELVEWDDDQVSEGEDLINVSSSVIGGVEDAFSAKDCFSIDCPRVVSLRLSTRRWILTQQSLWKEGRLSQEQLRHLAFLGLTWILSPNETSMTDKQWQSRYCEVTEITQDLSHLECTDLPSRLHDWLMHQRGLMRLGWQTKNRINILNELGFCWTFEPRTSSEREWDANLASLLKHKQENHNLQIPEDHKLGIWLTEQLDRIEGESLSSLQCAQLKALGVTNLAH